MDIKICFGINLKLGLLFALFLITNSFGQNVEQTLSKSWVNSAWINEFKETNTYDTNGYLIFSISQDWITASNSWQNASQYFYTNNSDGTVNRELIQFWDNSSILWKDSQRNTYTYSTSKKVLTALAELWDGANWNPFYREENSYDGSDYLIRNLSQYWNPISLSWDNDSQYLYTNNPNGTVHEILNQKWDITNSQWNNEERISQTYNSNNKVLTATIEYWINNVSEYNALITYTYDGTGLLTNLLFQNWDLVLSSWTNNTQYLYNYNGNSTISQITSQLWNIPNSLWNNWLQFNYTYSNLAITNFDAATEFQIYPNPSTNQINIKKRANIPSPLYQISDQTGRLLLKGKLENEITPLDISPFPSGIYYFQTDKNRTIKIIKN